MQIQIVNFQLKDLSEADYYKVCDELAPAFASVPGLVAKEWLADPSTNTYGGVYHWKDRESMEAYLESDLCKAVVSHPNLAGITSTDFQVMESASRVTRGLVATP